MSKRRAVLSSEAVAKAYPLGWKVTLCQVIKVQKKEEIEIK